MFHEACKNGDLKLLKFFIEKAGPDYMNILDKIINLPNDLQLTPLYLLCEVPHSIKNPINPDRHKMLTLLVEGDDHVKKLPYNIRVNYTARWNT